MINTFLYMTYYGIMKMIHREKLHFYVWALVILSIATWVCLSIARQAALSYNCLGQATALFFFQLGVTDKFLTPEESRKLNKPCVLFDFFDYHGTVLCEAFFLSKSILTDESGTRYLALSVCFGPRFCSDVMLRVGFWSRVHTTTCCLMPLYALLIVLI